MADDAAASGSNAASAWVAATHTGTTATATISSLSAGTTYRVRVRAKNTHGSGGWAFGTGQPGALSAPTSLKVVDGDRRLLLTWTAPTETVTGYKVDYTSATEATLGDYGSSGSNAATSWVAVTRSGTTASQTITGLTIGTTYRVRVRGQNTNGNGAFAFGSGTPTKPVLTFANASESVSESDASNIVNVNAAPTLATASSVNFRVDPASTASSDEYSVAATGTVAADAGTPAAGAILDVNDDTVNEPHKTVIIHLEAITNAPYTLGTQKTVTVTIQDNDPPAAPTDLTLTGGDRTLTARWNMPAGPVSLYELRVKEASAPDQAGTVTTDYPAGDPSTGWNSPAAVAFGGTLSGTIPGPQQRHRLPRAGARQRRPDRDRQRLQPVVGPRRRARRPIRTAPPRQGPDGRADRPRRAEAQLAASLPYAGRRLAGERGSRTTTFHYTSAAKSAVGNNAAAGTDPTVAWVAASRNDWNRALAQGPDQRHGVPGAGAGEQTRSALARGRSPRGRRRRSSIRPRRRCGSCGRGC